MGILGGMAVAKSLLISVGQETSDPRRNSSPTRYPEPFPERSALQFAGFTARPARGRPDNHDLRSGQAVRAVVPLALQDLRIEFTRPRIFQESVLDAVASVASCQHSVVEQ